MPIYEYACNQCSHTFDVLQKMSEAPLQDCPECGQPELRKLMSAPSFRLKGGGWYETDFKTGDKRNLHGDEAAKKSSDEKTAGKQAKDEKPSTGAKTDKAADKQPAKAVKKPKSKASDD